jgi:hypothetical protein
MSRDLLVLAALATICIILSPLYKGITNLRNNRLDEITTMQPVNSSIIKSKDPKTIVLLADTFLPGSYAGSEISAYETLKYLRSRGHNILIFIQKPKAEEYDGFKIYKYNTDDDFCRTNLLAADCVLFQMKDSAVSFKIIQDRKKPIFIMIHMGNSYQWVLSQKMSFPVFIVYNSRMTQDSLPTIHDNMVMLPYVDTQQFYTLRDLTVRNNTVCLVNCNKNKGSQQFYEIAEKMPHVQFIAVKGGYGEQDIKTPKPENVTYVENQTDIKKVFKDVGILLMPSKNETWGRTAVEAMASGIPVIHSESAGLTESIGGAGILCQRNDIDAWCKGIQRILENPSFRDKLRNNGYRRVKEIEIEQIRGRRELAYKIEV